MNLAVNTHFRSDAPLPDALALLAHADNVASIRVPTVPKAANRMARGFNRAPSVKLSPFGGATSMFKARARETMPFARLVHVPKFRKAQMASTLLMAGSRPAFKSVPHVTPIDVLKAHIRRAAMVAGTLRQRFNANHVDMQDEKPDMERLAQARARGRYLIQQLVYA